MTRVQGLAREKARRRRLLLLLVLPCLGCGPGAPPPVLPAAPRDPPPVTACEVEDADGDLDGLGDGCEEGLARHFAPLLVVASEACDGSPGPPAGGYFHGAQRVEGALRLVYLPAWFVDCGWSGVKCGLPWVDCSPHAGDSEFVAVDVRAVDGRWTVEGIFLSAHCFGGGDGDCRWYRGEEMEAFRWLGDPRRSAPVVWVSEGRHANYPSRGTCDRGHHRVDTCDRNATVLRFDVVESRNVGSARVPVGPAGGGGCVEAEEVGHPAAVPGAVECFWVPRPFRGWQEEGEGATPYLRYLAEVAGF